MLDYSISPETRRSAYALKRENRTRLQIAEALGLTADQVVKVLGPARAPRSQKARIVRSRSAQEWTLAALEDLPLVEETAAELELDDNRRDPQAEEAISGQLAGV